MTEVSTPMAQTDTVTTTTTTTVMVMVMVICKCQWKLERKLEKSPPNIRYLPR